MMSKAPTPGPRAALRRQASKLPALGLKHVHTSDGDHSQHNEQLYICA